MRQTISHVQRKVHIQLTKKTIGFMRTDTALYVFVFAYDILETQFPKLSKNTVECHSKKRERERQNLCDSFVFPTSLLISSVFVARQG